MPRPRFYKLEEASRYDLLDRATREFVKNGYQGASLNRLLEAADLSKGSFYYYFDDRDDLFGAVLEHVMHFEGPPASLIAASSTVEFWSEVESWLEGLYAKFFSSKDAMALARELPKLIGVSPLPDAIVRMLAAMRSETLRILHAGQRVGAVRTDLPEDLLVAIVMKVGEALDVWLAEHLDQVAKKDPCEIRALSVSLFRRVLAPEGGALV
jgi:AcrR family transcriptional regulator